MTRQHAWVEHRRRLIRKTSSSLKKRFSNKTKQKISRKKKTNLEPIFSSVASSSDVTLDALDIEVSRRAEMERAKIVRGEFLQNLLRVGTYFEVRVGSVWEQGNAKKVKRGENPTLKSDESPAIQPLPFDFIAFSHALVPLLHLTLDPRQILLSPPRVGDDIPALSLGAVLGFQLGHHQIINDPALLVKQDTQGRRPLLERTQARRGEGREEGRGG